MDLKDKIVLAHKGYFGSECRNLFRENSKEVIKISTTKDYISIIELDIRKSKDGVLYCYHGTAIQYHFALKIPREFSALKNKYFVSSLQEILEIITQNKAVFLDIKDTNITKEDILGAFHGKNFREVILGNKSVSFLKRFNEMPKEFAKCINGNIFCGFYDLSKLRNNNYKYLEVVFPFQIKTRMKEEVEESGMEFRCAGLFFLSKKSYWNRINRYDIKHISSDFL